MFDWNTYLQLAEELSERGQEEYKRTAISRAYYSAFHSARNLLEQKNFFYKSRKNVHFAVWNSYENLGREYRKISIKGDRLKLKRTKADYDTKLSNIDKLMKDALREAQDINKQIAKLD